MNLPPFLTGALAGALLGFLYSTMIRALGAPT